jgi:hypothetical protein
MACGLPVCIVRRRVGRQALQWCQQCLKSQGSQKPAQALTRNCVQPTSGNTNAQQLPVGGRSVAATQLAATARAAKGWAATACGRQQASKHEPASQQEV